MMYLIMNDLLSLLVAQSTIDWKTERDQFMYVGEFRLLRVWGDVGVQLNMCVLAALYL